MQEAVQEELAQSRIVRLEALGTLYPTLSSGGTAERSDFHASQIRKVSVNYKPGKDIVQRMKDAGVKKVR